MKIYTIPTNKLFVLLIAFMLLSCDKGEIKEDNTTYPPANSPEQVESIHTKYYLPTLEWGQSKNEVKKFMKDYSLLFEDSQWLIFEKSSPYILMAYEFISNQSCAAYRFVPENSEILYKSEIYKFHRDNFSDLPEYTSTCYWDEDSKTYMRPIIYDSPTTTYYVFYWIGTKYLE